MKDRNVFDKKEVLHIDFIKRIAADFNIEITKEYVLNLPAEKLRIKHFASGRADRVRIFDGKNEHPYMLQLTRNYAALSIGVELRFLGLKNLEQIVQETGVVLTTEKCRICEGGGWSSEGVRYTYKDIYFEI